MVCPHCNTTQDPDARFCIECGAEILSPRKNRSAYRYALLLVSAILLACAVGYYKFFLPKGIAAVVNGEEISIAELDQEFARIAGPGESADPAMRVQALNAVITEHVLLQEARRAGTEVSREELEAAVAGFQSRSGLDADLFSRQVESGYGSMKKFEEAVRRGMIINKFIAAKIVPQGADRQTAAQAVNQWVRKATDAAVVRVTLAEEWSGAGCGCSKGSKAAAPAARGCGMSGAGCTMAKGDRAAAPAWGAPDKKKAAEAAIKYWHVKHGNGAVAATVTDFGCHMQVDIIQDNKTIASLRYQGGSISE
jgi:predicted nucleic acid-binding Zn ribbon protein